jgi:hypothetical protein
MGRTKACCHAESGVHHLGKSVDGRGESGVLQGGANYVSERAVVSALRRRIQAIGVNAPVVGGSPLATPVPADPETADQGNGLGCHRPDLPATTLNKGYHLKDIWKRSEPSP